MRRAVTAQERIARIARLRYREGVADYLEVLDAERNLFNAQQQLLATERAWLQNRATLANPSKRLSFRGKPLKAMVVTLDHQNISAIFDHNIVRLI